MPFKIKLKKSKQQYNVASKSVYVISVELLDNVSIECTLTADSTGELGKTKVITHFRRLLENHKP